MGVAEGVFDDLGGKFEARLRDHRIVTRTTRMREGDLTIANPIAVLEAKFDFNVLDRLHEPSFVGVERTTSQGSTYLIYEVVALRPTHFQMLGMDVAMPTVIRKEYLNVIETSWGKSDETWIDVISIPTKYRMDLEGGELKFSKARLVPLIGSQVHLLSKETVKGFLCVTGGATVGSLIGFDMPLTVNIDSVVKYHAGIFGFTGSGKSNLTSYLIREAIDGIPDLKVIIFDVAGEYSIHLLDRLESNGMIFSTESFEGSVEDFLNSQAIPETLQEKVKEDVLQGKVKALFDKGIIQRISLGLPAEATNITLGYILSILQKVSDDKGSGAIQASIALNKIVKELQTKKGCDAKADVMTFKEEDKESLKEILGELSGSVHGMSSLKLDITALIEQIDSGVGEIKENEAKSAFMNPEALSSFILSEESPQINIVYIPEPDELRQAASRFITRLLFLKKRKGARKKVLVILDEAQEFIPSDPRPTKDNFTEQSNRAVEALLRQGRKYRAHCWLGTQRVAHLNVNALQQLHSYFVSTLPRFYDRMVIADAFGSSYDAIEKTTELETGQWLFVSYKATRQKNVPAFIQAPDNEEILLKYL